MPERKEDRIRVVVEVPGPAVDAFWRFVERFGDWWPQAYTWSRDVLVDIGIEPREGGLCSERGPHGFRCDWGRVLAWDPPRALKIAWQIGPGREPVPDPAKASEVEIRFVPVEGGTRIVLQHRDLRRHGEGADAYRAAMGAPEGWPYILGCFARLEEEEEGR